MARKYADKTFDNIMVDMLAQVPDTLDKRVGSIIYDSLAPPALELEKAYTELDNVLERGFVDTATDEDLELRTKEQGVERKSAVATIRHLQCSGSSGRIFAGDRFLIDTVYFKATEQIDIPGVVTIESETVGSQTVVDYNDEVLSVEGIPGLEGAFLIEHEDDFNGVDAESDDALRERYYITVRRNPGSGNIDDYEFWCSEIVGVGKVIVQPLWDGPGTVKVTVLDSNGDPASPGLIADVKDYLDPDPSGNGMGKAPIGAHVTVEPAVPIVINILASVVMDGSKAISDIQTEFSAVVSQHFRGINLSKTRTVVFNKVGAVLLSVPGVADYDDLLLNGAAENILLATNEIPSLGAVTLSEV